MATSWSLWRGEPDDATEVGLGRLPLLPGLDKAAGGITESDHLDVFCTSPKRTGDEFFAKLFFF